MRGTIFAMSMNLIIIYFLIRVDIVSENNDCSFCFREVGKKES